jgi:hypothetical protein
MKEPPDIKFEVQQKGSGDIAFLRGAARSRTERSAGARPPQLIRSVGMTSAVKRETYFALHGSHLGARQGPGRGGTADGFMVWTEPE